MSASACSPASTAAGAALVHRICGTIPADGTDSVSYEGRPGPLGQRSSEQAFRDAGGIDARVLDRDTHISTTSTSRQASGPTTTSHQPEIGSIGRELTPATVSPASTVTTGRRDCLPARR
jgi:hypothetical protein